MGTTTDEADLSIYRLMEYQSATLALADELATAGAALDEAIRLYVHGPNPGITLPTTQTRRLAWRDVARCRQTLRDVLARHQAFKRQ